MDSAGETIAKWLRPVVRVRKAIHRVAHCEVEVKLVQTTLQGVEKSMSIEQAQSVIMKENIVKAIATLLHACVRMNQFQVQVAQQAKLLVTAVLISKFPDQVLQSSSDQMDGETGAQPDIYLEEEGRKCVVDASTAAHCLQKLVELVHTSPRRAVPYCTSLSAVLKMFSTSFDSWRKADKLRTVANLEESFMQTYSVYLGAMNGAGADGDANGPSRAELIVATQHQLDKVRFALVQVLGKQAAASKIEELCAAVEAAFYSAAMASGAPDTEADGSSSPIPTAASTLKPAAAMSLSQPLTPPDGGSPNEAAALQPNHQRILDKLSSLAGIHQERLAYEIVLNPYYRLPPLANPLTEETVVPRTSSASNLAAAAGEMSPRSQQTLTTSMSQQSTASVAQTLKNQMLRVMGDKLVNSLRRSTITSPAQVVVGQEVPIYYMPNGAHLDIQKAGTGSASFEFTRTPILTVRVLAIHKAQPSDSTPHSNNPFAELSIDVEYTSDGIREDGVSGERIVLADATVPDPTPLVVALRDLAQQIASFTPNRPDIQQEVLSSVDAALLSQMIVNRALDPVADLLPILQFFQRSLQSLQAPSRTAVTEAWIRALAESFYKVEGSVAPGTAPSSGQRRGKSIDEVAPLLPVYFERATAVVEEIQRDMANYYISVLVPVLQQQGHEFLKEKFQQRLLRGQVSLDATASLIYSQLTPAEAFQACVKDLVEAGACPEAGFSLADILPAASHGSNAAPTDGLQTTPSAGPASTGSHLVGAIVARSILTLLQLPFRLDAPEAAHAVPETLVWDAPRLAAMRDLVDRIALECSLVIACKQVMGRYQLPPWCGDATSEVELQHRLDVLLTEKDTSMASISAEVVRYVLEALHKFRQAHLAATTGAPTVLPGVSPRTLASVPATHPALAGGDSQEVNERVSKALKDVVAHGNPVLQLFSKRVYKVLLRAMLGHGFKHLLPSYSLQSPAQQRNLSQLVQSVCRLYTHTMRIHKDVYTVVIGRAVADAQGAQPAIV